jgi:hypothetical protein
MAAAAASGRGVEATFSCFISSFKSFQPSILCFDLSPLSFAPPRRERRARAQLVVLRRKHAPMVQHIVMHLVKTRTREGVDLGAGGGGAEVLDGRRSWTLDGRRQRKAAAAFSTIQAPAKERLNGSTMISSGDYNNVLVCVQSILTPVIVCFAISRSLAAADKKNARIALALQSK